MADDTRRRDSIPLTRDVEAAILRYLELRHGMASSGWHMMPMEIARRNIGVAVLDALDLPTAPRPIGLDAATVELRTTMRRTIPFVVRAKVMARDGFRCVQCESILNLEIDHILPVSRGGSDDEINLQTLCGRCNRVKGDRLEGE